MIVRGLALPSLAGYQRRWLPKDVVAGLVLSALLVPQGMAYAELAGLPAVTGLYTSILCLVGYALVGPSRILVLGPDSSLGPMIAATILPLVGAGGDPAKAVALASALAIVTGAIMIGAGVGRLGFVADLLSKPTILGYMNGLALTILVGQLPKLLGFSVDADGFVGEVAGVVQGSSPGRSCGVRGDRPVLARRHARARPLPPEDSRGPGRRRGGDRSQRRAVPRGAWRDRGGSAVQGLPLFTIPHVGFSDLPLLLVGALGISLVALADTISTATSFAERQGEQVDGNREMIGIGTANVAAGLFQGFPVSTSGSRTAVAEQAGAHAGHGPRGRRHDRADAGGLPRPARRLPQPTLAAVVIAAAVSLADIPATRRLFAQRRADFSLSIAAFLGVVLLGVLPGIVVAIVLSVGNVFRRIWWPYRTTSDESTGSRACTTFASTPMPRCSTDARLRFDAPLIFANASTFRDDILRIARTSRAGLDHRRGRADHRRRHHCLRHARGSGDEARRGRASGVRGDEDPPRRKIVGTGSSTSSETTASSRPTASPRRRTPRRPAPAGFARPAGRSHRAVAGPAAAADATHPLLRDVCR